MEQKIDSKFWRANMIPNKEIIYLKYWTHDKAPGNI